MRLALALLAGLACLAAAPAVAGPWARGEGETFLSLSWEGTADAAAALRAPDALDLDHLVTIYAERGLTPRLTFGLDAAGAPGGTYSGYAFLRRTLSAPDAVQQWAVMGGLGLRDDGGLAVLGASWGRGLETRWGGGWTNVDAQARLLPEGGVATKVDGTLGLKPWDGTSFIGQLQLSDYPDADPAARLSTSWVREVRDGISLEMGVLQDLTGPHETGLKIGTWLAF